MSDTRTGFIIKSLLTAGVVVVVLVAAAIFYLERYTRHGDEVQVPDLREMYVEEAQLILREMNLSVEVIDSTYSKKVAAGAILDQQPAPGANTKRDRTIYVVVNARQRRPVILPELKDVSLRQAEAQLRSQGIVIDTVIYQSSVYRDLVLDVRRGDESLEAGTTLQEGTVVSLIVGDGEGSSEWDQKDEEEDEFF